ncbi:hypothetical protein [Kitasatospora sp. NPDC057198]|uniref:hypothetical protein n=1 Tax=Kitasatospora sp. NPDC057198 TaxID=3346046 RepID=UPI00363A1190
MRRRLAGAALAAAALAAVAAAPAAATDIDTETVTAVGSPSGVEARCPHGWTASDARITNGDGSPLAPDQRWHMTGVFEDGILNGAAGWIAPYLDSPPPPESIAITVVCHRDC